MTAHTTRFGTLTIVLGLIVVGSVIYGRTNTDEATSVLDQQARDEQASEDQLSPVPEVILTDTDDGDVAPEEPRSETKPLPGALSAEQTSNQETSGTKKQPEDPVTTPTTGAEPVIEPEYKEDDTPLQIPEEFNAVSNIQIEIGGFLNEKRAAGDADPVPELVAWLNARSDVQSAVAEGGGVYVFIVYSDGSHERIAL